LSKKGRKTNKTKKRQSIRQDVAGSITLVTDQKSEDFRQEKLKDPAHKPEGIKKPYRCGLCDQEFLRSEHCKRHLKCHSDECPFHCYLNDRVLASDEPLPCRAGRKNDGAQNRGDNARTHACTHLSAWLAANDPLVRAYLLAINKTPRGRNVHISPVEMLVFVRARGSVEQSNEMLAWLNKETGKNYSVHIMWEEEGCPVVRCIGGAGQPGGCQMCRPPRIGKRKSI
jgi:hypothetical protein